MIIAVIIQGRSLNKEIGVVSTQQIIRNLDAKKKPNGAILSLRYVDPSAAVCSITTVVEHDLKPSEEAPWIKTLI
ncbi:MAG: hypothetical protein K0R08_1057 [Solimicrobium sp.]|jgi:hypothetical protein|nr:hypothetical protein [Solimicrobium sp.]